MNKKLAATATSALTGPGFESRTGFCQRFVRQVVQATLGHEYDGCFKASAVESMAAFKGTPYAVKVDPNLPGGGAQPGDLLYKGRKTSGRFGHVGICIGTKVAENSSSHVGETTGDRDARGTRSLAAFGAYELIVRLPSG